VCSTVVEHLTLNPKIKGSNADLNTERERINIVTAMADASSTLSGRNQTHAKWQDVIAFIPPPASTTKLSAAVNINREEVHYALEA
jgi:hypothetical protein